MDFPKISKEIFNPINENLERLVALFPDAVKDGQLDVSALQAALGQVEAVSDNQSERYELGWAGKAQAKRIANMDVIGRTLRYIPEDSKNADTTENLYIEGDNLEVLKLLRNSYYNKIKMIYIDPPYNTGNDFVYKDKFATSEKAAAQAEGDVDDEGNRLVINQKTSGRYHSNWLSMIYPRLKVARDLLVEEGVIFISIDENEYHRLRAVCDEVFGPENFIADFVWQNKKGGGNDSTHVAVEHEYIAIYCKNKELVDEFYQMYTENYLKRYKEEDEQGKFYWDTFKRKSGKQYYSITCPDGTIMEYDEDGNKISWLRSEKRFLDDLKIGDARFVNLNSKWSIQFKQRLPKGKTPRSIYVADTLIDDKGTTSNGSDDVFQYFGKDVFSNPKPVELLVYLVSFALADNEYALDFFSGSGTFAESIYKANSLDEGHRKFILVQIAENLNITLKETPANKRLIIENAISVLDELHKPHLLTELGKERIRRAGEKIKQDLRDKQIGQSSLLDSPTIDPDKLDIGFMVFRTADTNIRWISEAMLSNQIHLSEDMMSDKDRLDFNPGYTDLDVVYEILLRHRDIPLSTMVEPLPHIGKRMYLAASTIAVCLEETITDAMIDAITSIEPLPTKIIFRDSAFGADITLKENTMLRLEAQMKRASGSEKRAYRVEFI